LQADQDAAVESIEVRLVTRATFHAKISPMFHTAVFANIDCMLSTDAVFHAAMFWLNASASKNIEAMFATRATFHKPMLALKTELLNIEPMEVAAATFALFSIMGTELEFSNWMFVANSRRRRKGVRKTGTPPPPQRSPPALLCLCLCLADLRRKSTRQSELQATHGRCPQLGGGGCQCP
jgi:hypothetical protein